MEMVRASQIDHAGQTSGHMGEIFDPNVNLGKLGKLGSRSSDAGQTFQKN